MRLLHDVVAGVALIARQVSELFVYSASRKTGGAPTLG